MRVSEWAKLGKSQAELDFVDVVVGRDTKLFVDPYALEIRKDVWSDEAAQHVRSYFSSLVDALVSGDEARAEHLVEHLHEAKETFLGLSKGEDRGNGFGPEQSEKLLEALKKSRAVKTGVLSELGEAELFIRGVGKDKISDLTTNVIRRPLIQYTHQQAELWGMPLTPGLAVGPVWSVEDEDWVQELQSLPVILGRPVILVPKYIVRRKLSLDSQEFYNNHILSFLQAEYGRADRSLAKVVRGRHRQITKKELKEKYPKSKEFILDFVIDHPNILELYKKIKGAKGSLSPEDFLDSFDEIAFARSLVAGLKEIPVGNDAATQYHRYCFGALTFLFYPELVNPRKEREINQGRKRIDIAFTNAATVGFFNARLRNPSTRSNEVPVECKNYGKEVGNPELDQICGRFSFTRGFFGMICCRSIENRERFLERCRDAAKERGQFVLTIDDLLLTELLEAVASGFRQQVDTILVREFGRLVA